MALSTDSLAVLARKRAAVGPVPAVQSGSSYSAVTGAATDADSVDVSEAIFAHVEIKTDDTIDMSIMGQVLSGPTADEFETVSGGETRTIASPGWHELVNVATLGKLFVEVSAYSSGNYTITISPCLG